MFVVAALIFGMVAFQRLSINLLPDITYPTVTVRTEYEGAAPSEVERLITEPIEGAVGVVTNVIRVSSTSRPGVSDVIVEFAWGTEMDFAALDIREKLDLGQLLRESPDLTPRRHGCVIVHVAMTAEASLDVLKPGPDETRRSAVGTQTRDMGIVADRRDDLTLRCELQRGGKDALQNRFLGPPDTDEAAGPDVLIRWLRVEETVVRCAVSFPTP